MNEHEHEHDDDDGMDCARGCLVALMIEAALFFLIAAILYSAVYG